MNELTQISTAGEVALPIPVFDTGLNSVITIKPSRLSLVQAQTENPRGAKPGQILDEDTGAIYDSLTVTIIGSHEARVYFPPGVKPAKGIDPLCRSNNGKVPADNVKQRQATSCMGCKQAAWNDGLPSPCKLKLELIVCNLEDGLPYYLTVGGLGLGPVRKVLGKALAGVGNKYISNLHFAATFTGVKQGQVYRLDIPKVQPLTDDQAATSIALYHEMNAQRNATQYVEAEQVADNAVSNIIEGEIITQEV